ncbi:MAG: regulatory signaling modulator protein AmpE [Legionellales bacterium]|nr:regulatory signaling modulator protein AmpE [Legionellales bacterium]
MFTLFVVIITLMFEYAVGFNPQFRCYFWFESYLNLLQPWVKRISKWREWSGYIAFMLPILLLTLFFNWLFCEWIWGLVGLLFNIAILIYCLGPRDLLLQFGLYKEAYERGDNVAANQHLQTMIEAPINADELTANRELSHHLFIQANQRIFAVLFWYSILGVVGAVLYRFTVIFKNIAQRESSDYGLYAAVTQCVQTLMDFIPARLVGLAYACAGDFVRGFNAWREFAWGNLHSSYELLKACGIGAIAASKRAKSGLAENVAAIELIQRSIWLWVIVYALIIFFGWLL